MSEIHSTLLAEGPNDEALTYHLTWLLSCHFPEDDVQPTAFVTKRGTGGKNLAQCMRIAVRNQPCDILFVHRDADSADAEPRHQEIQAAHARIREEFPNVVAVVPIQETESWLLFNADAIFAAVGRTPQGSLALPPLSRIEQQSNPKEVFCETLREAHGSTGRRAADFNPHHSQHYIAIARAIADTPNAFKPLLDHVNAFQRLNRDIEALTRNHAW